MFRNQYDSDVTVWSPQGRMHQVDYAVEAMKQGSATVGIKSETHAVLAALKRAQNELCSHQKKIYEIDTHAGVSIAGLLSDGRILARFLQTECSSWRWDYKVPVPISSLADNVQLIVLVLELQANTQYYGRRPFGVGLLIAGYDKDGTHIVQSDPSAEVVEMFASSIGARSQSARTYLERNLDKFRNATADELIEHALLALRDTLPAEENLTSQNTSIAIVGKGQLFKIMDDSEVSPYLTKIGNTPRTTAQPESPAVERMQQ
ncbi:putative multicatalytic endopeptidase [Dictyocaulus viviparus]|uniref:Proteasome subunit alpha type n=1 Tax=Dictyocaulus viviparus TaxID=29172 RepID=A0A0D8XTX0_DICVI|nr:putative multicatalytic endopeptidase [Dictyocaulus viviparus]